jgi:hypothetical protein
VLGLEGIEHVFVVGDVMNFLGRGEVQGGDLRRLARGVLDGLVGDCDAPTALGVAEPVLGENRREIDGLARCGNLTYALSVIEVPAHGGWIGYTILVSSAVDPDGNKATDMNAVLRRHIEPLFDLSP